MDRKRFISLALELPEATIFSLNDSTDLRVRNKTFASFPMGRLDVVLFRFSLDQQDMLTASEPELFSRLDQYLGSKGWIEARLKSLNEKTARSAFQMAWANAAPKGLVKQPIG